MSGKKSVFLNTPCEPKLAREIRIAAATLNISRAEFMRRATLKLLRETQKEQSNGAKK